MNVVKEIPGFYYDQEKKKYFKIQGSTAPAGSAYSSDDVKRRKARDHHEAQQAKRAKQEKGRIRRFATSESILSGFLRKRELGDAPSLDLPRRILAGELVLQGYYRPLTYWDPIPHFFNIRPYPGHDESVAVVHSVCDSRVSSSLLKFDRKGGMAMGNPHIQWFGSSGATTSLSSHDTEGYHAISWYSHWTDAGIGIWRGLSSDRTDMTLGPGGLRGNNVDVFSSMAAPPQSPLLFVFGTSNGILTIDKERLDLVWLKDRNQPHLRSPKDVFALEFLSVGDSNPNPFTLLSGGRRGLLNRIDLRAPVLDEESASIYHPSSITHIKQVNEHRIIVPGLRSSMCQYDLRFLKATEERRPGPDVSRKTTIPYLQYPEYKNEAVIAAGFDIDTESGLVAAAQERDDYRSNVQIFSLHDGHKIQSPEVSGEIPTWKGKGFYLDEELHDLHRPQDMPRCIRWVKETEGTMKSLYVGFPKRGIFRFAWGDESEDEEKPPGKELLMYPYPSEGTPSRRQF